MNILIVIGLEDKLGWSTAFRDLNENNVHSFSPIQVCRTMLEDWMCIDPGQGDLVGVAKKFRGLVQSMIGGCFHRLLLRHVRSMEAEAGDCLVVVDDAITIPKIEALRLATLHKISVVTFGQATIVGDIRYNREPDPDEFVEIVLKLLGKEPENELENDETESSEDEEPKELENSVDGNNPGNEVVNDTES